MTNSITLNSHSLGVVNIDGEPWVTSKELSQQLGYKRADQVAKIYSANKDEFTEKMTQVFDFSDNAKSALSRKMRIFSLRGSHLIAMFSKTEKAKLFRRWILDVIENIQTKAINERQPRLDDLSTSDERVPLRQAVSSLVTKKGLIYSEAYNMVNQRFGHKHLEEYTISEVPKAVEYVHQLILSEGVQGELLPKTEPVAASQSKGITMLELGGMAEKVQSDRIWRLKKQLTEMQDTLEQVIECSSIVGEGYQESWGHFNFTKKDRKKGKEQAKSRFDSWQMSKRIF